MIIGKPRKWLIFKAWETWIVATPDADEFTRCDSWETARFFVETDIALFVHTGLWSAQR